MLNSRPSGPHVIGQAAAFSDSQRSAPTTLRATLDHAPPEPRFTSQPCLEPRSSPPSGNNNTTDLSFGLPKSSAIRSPSSASDRVLSHNPMRPPLSASAQPQHLQDVRARPRLCKYTQSHVAMRRCDSAGDVAEVRIAAAGVEEASRQAACINSVALEGLNGICAIHTDN
jgi:hypothetical protein